MSKIYLCAMYNTTTERYSVPLAFQSPEEASESFHSELSRSNDLRTIKDHIRIFCLGRYCTESANLKPYMFKKLILDGSQLELPPLSTDDSVSES